jgi:predicted ATP-dependent endonuclease of OLD family
MLKGILSYLQLNGVGPVKELCFEPNQRLNIITGDNSFGKTFLLECAWWALAGMWAGNPVYPGENAGKGDAKISFQLTAKSRSKEKRETVSFDWESQQWPKTSPGEGAAGLVIYARVDNSFAVWDPVSGKVQPPVGAKKPSSPLIFDKKEIIEGIIEEIPGKEDRSLCNGLLVDWVNWQKTPDSPFAALRKILHELSTVSQEPIKPGEPVRIPGTKRLMPSLLYPYGIVPFVYAASSVQRIISLAYLILWTWEEHKIACKETQKTPHKNMIILIDEIESHLHPQWQRSIIPSLLEVKKHLDNELNIQFLVTTHSPLVLTSIEPVFEEETDKLFHLETDDNEIVLKEQPFLRHGRVDNWFTSDTFGLLN